MRNVIFSLGGIKCNVRKVAGRILLGVNTGCRTVMLQTIVFLWTGVLISAGFLSYAYT